MLTTADNTMKHILSILSGSLVLSVQYVNKLFWIINSTHCVAATLSSGTDIMWEVSFRPFKNEVAIVQMNQVDYSDYKSEIEEELKGDQRIEETTANVNRAFTFHQSYSFFKFLNPHYILY